MYGEWMGDNKIMLNIGDEINKQIRKEMQQVVNKMSIEEIEERMWQDELQQESFDIILTNEEALNNQKKVKQGEEILEELNFSKSIKYNHFVYMSNESVWDIDVKNKTIRANTMKPVTMKEFKAISLICEGMGFFK